MITALIVLGVILWLAVGILAEGLTLGYFTREYPSCKNSYWNYLLALGGPLDLLATLLFLRGEGPYVFRLKPYSKEQRWRIFRQEYYPLGRDYFDRNVK